MVCSYSRRVAICLAAASACAMAIAGCGEPGGPQPPSLNLAQPVRDLTATRTGTIVHLAWKSVDRTTDHTPMPGGVRTHICRTEGNGPCELVTDLPLKLGELSHFDDALPSEELQGPPQLLTYYVELLNHGRKSAGRSNAAYSASGQAAPDLSSLSATVRPEGVELHWARIEWPEAAGAEHLVRITRVNQSPVSLTPKADAGSGSKSLLSANGAATHEAVLQTLEVRLAPTAKAGNAMDTAARFGQTYQYKAVCVEKLVLDGHAIESLGALSEPATLFTRDVFPPAVPQQLAAVADTSSHAIDLSWSPDSDPDLAGYVVYRHSVTASDAAGAGGTAGERLSGAIPLTAPSFHDAQAQPGVAYAYSVSAVDRSGNESAHSSEAQETVELPR